MIKVGITGSIATGKSYVEELFRRQGAATLDTDAVAHKVLEGNADVIKKFGTTDRQKLAGIVFSDPDKLKELEAIIHPEVKRIVAEFFNDNRGHKLLAVCVPLLYEAQMEAMFDVVVMLISDEDIQLQRLINTRNMSREEALKRIRSRDIKPRGDYIIENNGTIAELETKVDNIIKQLKGKADDPGNR